MFPRDAEAGVVVNSVKSRFVRLLRNTVVKYSYSTGTHVPCGPRSALGVVRGETWRLQDFAKLSRGSTMVVYIPDVRFRAQVDLMRLESQWRQWWISHLRNYPVNPPARLRYGYPQVTNSTFQIADYAEHHIRSRRRVSGL